MKDNRLNTLQKWYLKYTDRPAYIRYKASRRENEFHWNAVEIKHPALVHPYKELTSFKHSGNSGDIIYALPSIYALSKNGKAKILLNINQKGIYSAYHPLGGVMLNEKMVEMLRPLFLYQPQIESCEIYKNEKIDYDLDIFRKYPFLLDRGSISRWYFLVYAISHPLNIPWLKAPKDESVKDHIIIARSHRYRSPHIDYSFLSKYPRLLFIGVPEEFEDMKLSLPALEHRPVKDFLEMASLINGCRLFIGNQSFPFSIAEGLKANRLLEVFYKAPNVIPEGAGAYDFMFQPQFEALTAQLYNNPAIK